LSIYHRYLIFLVLVSCLIDIFLAFVKQNDIAVYFTLNVIAYLTITMLFVFFSPKTRRILSVVSVVYLTGFMVVVTLKILGIMHLK
jgi:hypothetical protein